MLEFGTKFELDLRIKNAGIIDDFLKGSHESIHGFLDGFWFNFKVFFHFLSDAMDSSLNLFATDFEVIIFGFKGYTSH